MGNEKSNESVANDCEMGGGLKNADSLLNWEVGNWENPGQGEYVSESNFL